MKKAKVLLLLLAIFLFNIGLFSFTPSIRAASTVATTIETEMTSHQRKCFYGNNYFWVFYYKRATGIDKLCYKSSSDGLTWGSETEVFSDLWVWYDFDIYYAGGTTIHMAYCDSSGSPTYVVNYTTGTLGSGSITWGNHYTVVSGDVDTPSVTVDTNTALLPLALRSLWSLSH